MDAGFGGGFETCDSGPASASIAVLAAGARTGIDPETGLASDFLNQYNEVAMLLDLAADDPDIVEELEDWRPRDYVAHFSASGFPDRHIVLQAYALSPTPTRQRFDGAARELADILIEGVAFLRQSRAAGAADIVTNTAATLGAEVRTHLNRLDQLIHAGRAKPAQSLVDDIFAQARA